MKTRCTWCLSSELYIHYHDEEWGVPIHEDQQLFEMLCLEGAQAGLSWITVLNKRAHYRKVFDGFDANKIARYSEAKRAKLLADPGIIRNKLKINAFITNAQKYLEVKNEFDSFDQYIWQFVDHQPIINKFSSRKAVPASTIHSDAMAKDLKKRGFKFVGTTICYAFMQASGMVNDHTTDCFRHKELGA